MKKVLAFLFMTVALSSCSEDVKFNNEAVFQGVKDNLFWRGSDATAIVDSNDQVTVSATTLIETVSLEFPMPDELVFTKDETSHITMTLGNSVSRVARYSFFDEATEFTYSTGSARGDGQIVITEYDGMYISGTFRFNAPNDDPDSEAAESVNMQNGVFYRIPVQQPVAP